jgi:ketosteroid isomerase-like protein
MAMRAEPNNEGRMLYANSDLSNAAALLQRAFAARDGVRVAALHAENALALYPQPLPTLGREAIKQVWNSFFAAADFRYPITVDEILESEQGDLGYTIGRWWLIQPSAGLNLAGRYVDVWQPNNGAWEITHAAANTYLDITSEEPPR